MADASTQLNEPPKIFDLQKTASGAELVIIPQGSSGSITLVLSNEQADYLAERWLVLRG